MRSTNDSLAFSDDINRVKFAMNAAGIGVWEMDIANNRILWNDRCCELVGLSELHVMPYDEVMHFVHPEDATRVNHAMHQALRAENGGSFDSTYRTIGADQILRWVNTTGKAYFDDAGQPVWFGGIMRRVDHSSTLESASEARFQKLVQHAAVGMVLLTGEDMRVALVNEAYGKLIGHPVANIMGRPIFDVIPDAESFFKPIIEKVRATGLDQQLDNIPYQVLGHDGRIMEGYLKLIYQPYRDIAENISGVMVVAHDVTEAVTAQQRIKDSESFTRLLSNSVPAMIFYMDAEHRYISYNETFMQWYKVDATQAVGRAARDFIGEEAYARIQPNLAKAFAGKQVRFEMPAPSRIGPDRWLSIVYTPHIIEGGEVLGIIAHATDITASKRTEIALRENEGRFRAIFEQAPIATCLFVGKDMRIEVANQLMLDLWGKPASVIGKPLTEGVPELVGQSFLGILNNVFTTGKAHTGKSEEAQIEVNGALQSYYYDYTYQPVFNNNGEVYGVLDMAIDVTERVMSAKKIEDVNAIIHSAVELAALETWALDVKTNTFTMSDKLCGWLGYGKGQTAYAEALFGKSANDLVTGVENAPTGKLDMELNITDPATGQQRILHVQGQMLYDEKGCAQQLRGMALDITLERNLRSALETEVQLRTEELQATNEELQATNEELHESNQSLIHSNEELSQYAYVASHDLQEPLRKIHFFSEKVAASGELSATNIQLLGKVMSSAERMTTLIRALLEFSRLQRTSSDLTRPTDLNVVVKAVVNDFELMITQKNAVLTIGRLPTIEAVGLQMNQLFYNLLGNSLKFTKPDEQPVIVIDSKSVSLAQASWHVPNPAPGTQYHHITISDNGIGFEEQFTEQIFEVFKRLHGKGVYPGSGIGLALCRRIVRNHGGALYAEGNPGHGSIFHIILPGLQNDTL